MKEVEGILGFHKVNTSAYHPQTDGLVERLNKTLTTMLAKTVNRGGKDWDQCLPFVLFVYRASQQQSTPFYLLYGQDPRLPVDAILCPAKAKKLIGLQEYGCHLATKMSEAWELARQAVQKAQEHQKRFYDWKSRPPNFKTGESVFCTSLQQKQRSSQVCPTIPWALSIIEMDANTARIRRVDNPQEEPILVALDRLRRCPVELSDDYWPPNKTKRLQLGSKKKALPANLSGDPTIVDWLSDHSSGDPTFVAQPNDQRDTSSGVSAADSPTEPRPAGDETVSTGSVPTDDKPTKSTSGLISAEQKTAIRADSVPRKDELDAKGLSQENQPRSDCLIPRTKVSGGKWTGRLRRSRHNKSAEDV